MSAIPLGPEEGTSGLQSSLESLAFKLQPAPPPHPQSQGLRGWQVAELERPVTFPG